jgi:hypothetical protein
MTKFRAKYQEIMIGLLGLKHPEILIRARPVRETGKKDELPAGLGAMSSPPISVGWGLRALQGLRFVLAALVVGSRTVALADNSQLSRDLADRAAVIYGESGPS